MGCSSSDSNRMMDNLCWKKALEVIYSNPAQSRSHQIRFPSAVFSQVLNISKDGYSPASQGNRFVLGVCEIQSPR